MKKVERDGTSTFSSRDEGKPVLSSYDAQEINKNFENGGGSRKNELFPFSSILSALGCLSNPARLSQASSFRSGVFLGALSRKTQMFSLPRIFRELEGGLRAREGEKGTSGLRASRRVFEAHSQLERSSGF